MRRLVLVSLGMLCLSGLASYAQEAAQPTVDARQALEYVAEHMEQRVVIDPALKAAVRPPQEAKTIADALDAVTAQVDGLRWKKVYLRVEAGNPEPRQLVEWVRAAYNMEAAGIILTDERGERMTYAVRNVPADKGYFKDMDKKKVPFQPQPVYVVFYPKPPLMPAQAPEEGQGPSAEVALDLSQKWFETYAQMSPNERQRALYGMMQGILSDPGMVQQIVRDGIGMWMRMTPDERNAFMNQARQMGERLQGIINR